MQISLNVYDKYAKMLLFFYFRCCCCLETLFRYLEGLKILDIFINDQLKDNDVYTQCWKLNAQANTGGPVQTILYITLTAHLWSSYI